MPQGLLHEGHPVQKSVSIKHRSTSFADPFVSAAEMNVLSH